MAEFWADFWWVIVLLVLLVVGGGLGWSRRGDE